MHSGRRLRLVQPVGMPAARYSSPSSARCFFRSVRFEACNRAEFGRAGNANLRVTRSSPLSDTASRHSNRRRPSPRAGRLSQDCRRGAAYGQSTFPGRVYYRVRNEDRSHRLMSNREEGESYAVLGGAATRSWHRAAWRRLRPLRPDPPGGLRIRPWRPAAMPAVCSTLPANVTPVGDDRARRRYNSHCYQSGRGRRRRTIRRSTAVADPAYLHRTLPRGELGRAQQQQDLNAAT